MDIGTAKPSMKEREGIVHWGFDLANPDERFTVKDWKEYTEDKIKDIQGRGKLAMVVGGTGLYVDALVFDYQFEAKSKGFDKNRGECIKNLNGRLGTLEQVDSEKYPDRQSMNPMYKIFGIKWDSEILRERLAMRAEQMFDDGLYKETEELVKKFGWNIKPMTSNIYQFAWKHMQGEITRKEAIRLFVIDDWHLAKRQLTWFKRNPNIEWLPLEKVRDAVIKCIQNE